MADNTSNPLAAYTIIIDTREKRPLIFPSDIHTERSTLRTGDYSIDGFECSFCVERKSVTDLVGSLTHDRERFERELQRMVEAEIEFRRVIVEASYRQVIDYITNVRQSRPAAVIASINAFEVRYGVPFIFAADPAEAAERVTNWARYFVREKQRRHEDNVFNRQPPIAPYWLD